MHKAYIERLGRSWRVLGGHKAERPQAQTFSTSRSCESFGLYRRIGGPQTIHLVPGVAGYSRRTFLLKS